MSIRRELAGQEADRAAALTAALAAAGIPCRVEPRGSLAVLMLQGAADALTSREQRQLALSLAREHGFTHLALEIAAGEAAADGR